MSNVSSQDDEGACADLTSLDGERCITAPAAAMCVTVDDMPSRWIERTQNVTDQPRLGQRDYACARFAVEEDGRERALVSFEAVVYKDAATAAGVFIGTLKSLGFMDLSKLDVGSMGAMLRVAGRPGKEMRAVAFAERNVFGLIMLSRSPDCPVSDSWLASMARLMASRMR